MIYYDKILELNSRFDIHGMEHITGGAFTRLRKFLNNSNVKIDSMLRPHDIFYELYSRGISDDEMYKTFNCGVGFILAVSDKDLESIILELNNAGFKSDVGRNSRADKPVFANSGFSRKVSGQVG